MVQFHVFSGTSSLKWMAECGVGQIFSEMRCSPYSPYRTREEAVENWVLRRKEQENLRSCKLLVRLVMQTKIGHSWIFCWRISPGFCRLKKGAPSISFTIYTYVYKVFRELFNSKGNYLDRYIVDEKVIDREGFAKSFFKVNSAALRWINSTQITTVVPIDHAPLFSGSIL